MSKVPKQPIPRTRCPCYGFFGAMGVFMDQRGNQCPLEVDSYHPCDMEMDGEYPDAAKCPRIVGQDISVLDKCRVFPREFHPGTATWEGMSFKEWREYVAGSECPRRAEKA